VLKKNPGTVKVVFKNFPIQRHQFSAKAAAAALAAASRGKFWEYHDRLFARENYGKLNDQKFLDIAKSLGMNPQEFDTKMKDPEIRAKVQRDSAEGKRAGVRGTPTIFINGRLLKNRSLKGFQEQIDRELKGHQK
jgi:protein-disulfide isomerase